MGDIDKQIVEKDQAGWNSLPPELKIHCIKEMDFKARSGLRCSSKTEMQLVDSVKQSFLDVFICLAPRELRFSIVVREQKHDFFVRFERETTALTEKQQTTLSENPQQFEKMTNFLKRVLNFEIDYLHLTTHGDSRGDQDQKLVTEIINQGPVLKIRKFTFQLYHKKTVGLAILKRCSVDYLTEIEIFQNYEVNRDFVKDFMQLPQVVKAHKLIIADFGAHHVERIVKYAIKKWASDGSRIGKELRTVMSDDYIITALLENLSHKVIRFHGDINAVLLRTDDPSKHIWMRFAYSPGFIQIFVVDAASEEEPQFDESRDDEDIYYAPADYLNEYDSSYNYESDY